MIKRIKIKARVHKTSSDHEVYIFVGNLWRVFGTPTKFGDVQPYQSVRSAMRGAEKLAKELDIELLWGKVSQ